MHNLILCAVSKHEGRYLKDFIEYYKALGVQKFVIYDEGSEHLTQKVLEPYAWAGLVEYIPATKHPIQYQSYANCISRYTGKTEWILFVDIDEFIVLEQEKPNLINYLSKYNAPNIGAVGMSWSCFGSNDKDVYEEKPVWDRIFSRVDYELTAKHHTRHIKSFVRPQCVGFVNDPHLFGMRPGFFTVDSSGRKITTSEWKSNDFPMDEIWLAHFVTKTRQEWEWKFARGSADSGADAYNARKIEMFDAHIKACTVFDYSVQNMARKLGL